jgi:hypothetical protein
MDQPTDTHDMDPLAGESTGAVGQGTDIPPGQDVDPVSSAPLSSGASRFLQMGKTPPIPPGVGSAGQGTGVQLGLGPLMGLGSTSPRGRYSGVGLRAAALDSLQNTCLGGALKVTEEVSAVKAALDASVSVREDELVKALCPPDVVELLRVPAFMALDAGIPMATVGVLWPAVADASNRDNVRRVLAWRTARESLRLFSRFESQPDSPGLAAFKAWHEHQAQATTEAARANVNREPLLRDALVSNMPLLHAVLQHQRTRAQAQLQLVKPQGEAGGSGTTGTLTPTTTATPKASGQGGG